ncbi:MAG: hypothetical protein U0X20_22990 [Caldilineaceae bacterium]
MYGLRFEDQPAIVPSDPNRADIACFVGYVAQRDTPLPGDVATWLLDRGWIDALPAAGAASAPLYQVPIPIDTWEAFDQLFVWEQRRLKPGGPALPTYMGAAIRTFFAQGGRKCYVVSAGPPWPYLEEEVDPAARDLRMAARLAELLPGYGGSVVDASPVEPRGVHGWRGLAHLFGLPDVALACLPDLPDIVRSQVVQIDPTVATPPQPEVFVECAATEPAPRPDKALRHVRAPRCDARGYDAWVKAIQLATIFLGTYQRETQLIASLPIPQTGSDAELGPLQLIAGLLAAPPDSPVGGRPTGSGSAFVQVAYPWVRTSASGPLPEGLESPDGVLAGMLARSALVRGAYATIAGQPPLDVYALVPALRRNEIETLHERLSLFVETQRGPRLLSDVTLSAAIAHRQAHTGRITASLLRAARVLGESMSFEATSEVLWTRVRDQLTRLLEQFRAAGAFRGTTPEDAYQVRCDRSTMTQNDIDNGRVVAVVSFDPAASIEAITVVLAMHEGGQATLAQSA